ncbi:MAG TPA: hypothetical protein PKC40_01205 [Saprospiraceae bacterium]|nr:hypothetical protein [Saprospiraceae bacterium]
MEDTLLIKVWERLSPVELKSFEKFIRSPFFNQREDVTRLYDWLVKNEKKQGLQKEAAFAFAYPGQDFHDQNFRLLLSYFFRLVEQFLSLQHILPDKLLLKQHLAEAYQAHGLTDNALRVVRQSRQILEKDTFENVARLEWQYNLRFHEFKFDTEQHLLNAADLQALSDDLDLIYLSKKLRQICMLLNNKAVYKTHFEIGFLNEIINYIEQKELIAHPSVGVYYFAYLTLSGHREEQHFRQFKKSLFEKAGSFPPEELHELHLLAINYCVRKLNEGNQLFFPEVLELYKEGLRTGTLLDNGLLSRFTYYNIVVAAIKTGDFSWAEDFIYSYKNSLEKRYRESIFSFNLARLEYSRKNYDTAMKLLQKANYRDVLFSLATKTLALKIYYELDEFDLLQSHLEAMKKFISRKHVIGYHRDNYLNIVRYTQKLTGLNYYSKKSVSDLRQQIENEEILTEKEWLLSQLGF